MIAFTGTPGARPGHFEFTRTGSGGPGKWAIVDDPTAEGGRAIEQTSNEKTDYRFPLAIYQPLSAKDVDVSLRFKLIAGAVDRSGGIAVRLKDAGVVGPKMCRYRRASSRPAATGSTAGAGKVHRTGARAPSQRITTRPVGAGIRPAGTL